MNQQERLYTALQQEGLIDIDFNQFSSLANDKNYQNKVYTATQQKGMYDGSFIEFQNKFFPSQAATTTATPTKPYVAPTAEAQEKSEEDLKIEQDAVNTEFWENQKYKREDY